jgi:hypothetical protein
MHTEGPLSPSRSDVTCAGTSCPDESVGSPPSAHGHFGRRSLAEDLVCRGTASQCGEGAIHEGDARGRVAPRSTSPSLEDIDLEEASVPSLLATCLASHQSLSPPTPVFPHWTCVSPPALRHPWAGQHPIDRKRSEKIKSRKPSKWGLKYKPRH